MAHQLKQHATTYELKLHLTYWTTALGLVLLLASGAMVQARTRFVSSAIQQGTVSSSAAQAEQEQRTLEPGGPIEREMAGGAVHLYRVVLTSGQYLHVSVEQRGIDVAVALHGPDGASLIEMDGLRGMLGIEELSWEAASTGSYILEVRARAQAANTARYEVRLQKAVMATPQDLARVAAERLFMEGVRAEGQAAGLESAVGKYGEAVQKWRAAGDRKWEGQTLNYLGSVTQKLSQRDKAREYFEQALAIGREIQDKLGEGTALNGLGTVYWNLSQNEKARTFYEQALAIWLEIKNRDGEGAALHNLGNIYRNLNQNQKAREYYEQALAIRRETKNRDGEATTLNGLGILSLDLSHNERAREYYGQALAIRRETRNRDGEAQALHNLGIVYRNLHQNEKARAHYEQALEIWRETGNRQGVTQALNNLGVLSRSLNQNEKAREYYEQSLALAREIKDRVSEGLALNNLGETSSGLRQYEKAREYYEQSLAIWRETKSRARQGSIFNNLGSIHMKLGQREGAREYYEQSLAISREIGNRYGEGEVLNNLGEVYWGLGQQEKAREHFEQAMAIWRQIKNREGEGYAHHNLGLLYRNLSQFEKARNHFEQALAIRREIGDDAAVAHTLVSLASLDRGQGRLSDALGRIESALGIIENLRTTYTNQELRSVYFSTVQDYYQFYIDLLIHLHKQHPSAGHDGAALQASERSRARSMLETLAELGADIRQGVDPQFVETERSLQRQLNTKAQIQLKLLRGPHTESQAAAMAKEIEGLTTEYQTIKARIRRNSPRYATLTQPVSLGLKEIQQLLDPDTLLLEYALGNDRSYLWAVSPTTIKTYELPKRDEIEDLARRVYESFSTSNGTMGHGYAEAASSLSRMLLGPVATELGKKRLLIISDGHLQYLPFAALPLPQVTGTSSGSGARGVRRRASTMPPLMVEHEIVNLPSASLLAVLRQELIGRTPAAKMIAVLADPVFDRNDRRIKPGTGSPGRASKDRENKFQESQPALRSPPEWERSASEAGVLSFDRLKSSRDEADEIVRLVRGGESLKALDFDASRVTALSEELSRYRVIHFATHGLLNNVHPELSGLVLSLVDERGQPQDGFLRAHEIYNLKLGADLVVLSACQTALGKDVRGEGLIGLTRGFMYAGSPRIVASLWQVPSKATAELMKRFYKEILVKGQRPAAALRAAQVEMWRDERWNEPYYWAAFVLQGEWQ